MSIARHERGHKIPVVLVMIWRSVVGVVRPSPEWLEVQPCEDLETGGVAGPHNSIRLGPIELAFGNPFNVAPLKQALLPVETSVHRQSQITLGGLWMIRDEHVHAVVQVGAWSSRYGRDTVHRWCRRREHRRRSRAGAGHQGDEHHPPTSGAPEPGYDSHDSVLDDDRQHEDQFLACPVTCTYSV